MAAVVNLTESSTGTDFSFNDQINLLANQSPGQLEFAHLFNSSLLADDLVLSVSVGVVSTVLQSDRHLVDRPPAGSWILPGGICIPDRRLDYGVSIVPKRDK